MLWFVIFVVSDYGFLRFIQPPIHLNNGSGDRDFSIAAPGLWNALPGSTTDRKSIGA